MARSQIIDVDGPVHYVDHGGDGPPMVLVHGLGGSHLNWIAAAPGLAERHRVYAVDLAGFGLTPLIGRRAAVQANRRLLDGFLEQVSPNEPVVLALTGTVTTCAPSALPFEFYMQNAHANYD